MDIHNVEFKRTFKGYSPEEVDDYLATLVIKYETLYQENRKLRDELKTLQKELEGQGHQEQDVLDLISLTKQTVQELKNMADQKATSIVKTAQADKERIISEARLEAQRLVADAEQRLSKAQKAERQLRENIRLTMESIWTSLTEEADSTDVTDATQVYQMPTTKFQANLGDEQEEASELTSE